MRAVAVLALALFGGCAELGVTTDGTSVSYGKPNRGRLIDGTRMPDKGDGFTTREVWQQRGNRYGTDELVHLLKAVSHRMRKRVKDVRLVIADLSSGGGGAAHAFHRSHQSGRDVDLLYYMRGPDGKPFEPDAMHVINGRGEAKDGSGLSVDVPRTWMLVKELLTAQEATVQFIFMYRPILDKVLAHAVSIGEPEALVARAIKALQQPGDSAPHNDHLHVRIYCPPADRAFGCVDIGPLELLAEREAEQAQILATIAGAMPQREAPPPNPSAPSVWPPEPPPDSATAVWQASAAAPSMAATSNASFSSLFRARADRIDLRSWR